MRLVIGRVSKGFLPMRDGWSAHAHFLSLYQARAGHFVFAMQPFHDARPQRRLELRKIDIGDDSDRIGEKLVDARFNCRAAGELWRLARRRPFDIVHAHGDVIEATIVGSLARLYLRVPFVMTLHGGLSNRDLYRRVARRVFATVDGFIAVSEGIRDDLLALDVPAHKIAVISSGIEYRRFARARGPDRTKSRRRLNVSPRHCLAVFVGRLHKMKGLDVLADAARLLVGEQRIRLLIVGDGPQRDEIRAMMAPLPNVGFYGAASRAEVQDLLRIADVFVLPSVDLAAQTEGTPTALIEAMASGLAVVASRTGGAPALVEHGRTGLLVEQRSPQALAGALRELAGDPRLRSRLGSNARRSVRRKDWSTTASLVVKAYHGFGCRSNGSA